MQIQRPGKLRTILEKKNEIRRFTLSDFKTSVTLQDLKQCGIELKYGQAG